MDWVSSPKPIVKSSLNFTGMFWQAVVYTRIQLTHADNTLTADHTILVVSIIAGYYIDFTLCIIERYMSIL